VRRVGDRHAHPPAHPPTRPPTHPPNPPPPLTPQAMDFLKTRDTTYQLDKKEYNKYFRRGGLGCVKCVVFVFVFVFGWDKCFRRAPG
jgi:hypothetical protein